jgi:DNA-binding LytR/AlgR family response regulator
MKLRVVIIDDEPLAQKGLEDHINETGFLELAGKAEDPIEALEILTCQNIDIVFLDIEMPKMSGITFLENLKKPPIVIICSAYAEYALKSFELDVLDYLLKPVTFERFTKAVVKAREFYELRKNGKHEIYMQSEYFFVKSNQKIEKINFDDINYLEAMGNYVTIHTNAKKFVTYLTLKGIEEYLPKDFYVRIHKSYLVPIDKIQSIDESDIKVADVLLPISRNYKEELITRINRKLFKRN